MNSYIFNKQPVIRNNQGLVHSINIIRFPKDYAPYLYIPALTYIYDFRVYSSKLIKDNELFSCCRIIFDLCYSNNTQISRNIADFLFNNFNNDSLINRMRDLEQQKRINSQSKPIKNTVYADSQNVHNSKINASVIQSAEYLINSKLKNLNLDLSNCIENIKDILISKYHSDSTLISKSLDYISINTSYFGKSLPGKKSITLAQVFVALWFWIIDSKDRDELEKRLLEELKEMSGYCTTGHLARLVSVIQGFTEDEKLNIRISEKDRMNSVIRNYLTKELEKCSDEKVLDGIIDKNDAFKDFIVTLTKNKLSEWEKEWKREEIFKVIHSFCEA